MSSYQFFDRKDAGERLARKIKQKNVSSNILLAVPRGGVVVGYEIAKRFEKPLYALVVKKIGAPGNQELAIGAIAEDDTVYWDKELLKHLKVAQDDKARVLQKAKQEVHARQQWTTQKLALKDKTVVVIDDGVATGATAVVSSLWLRQKGASKIILATPIIEKSILRILNTYYDNLIYLYAPKTFSAVGQFYREFPQISNKEVEKILSELAL